VNIKSKIMSLSLKTYSVNVPASDLVFFNEFVGKMGWIVNEAINEPCQMTEQEMRYEVMLSVEDADKGLGITLAEARKRHLAI
jgi:hypothetical protein